MIAKVQPSKRRSRSSFKRLLNYLTTERDATTGDTRLRGDVVLSGNLVGIDTAAAEMKALEFFNPRCHDAVFHTNWHGLQVNVRLVQSGPMLPYTH